MRGLMVSTLVLLTMLAACNRDSGKQQPPAAQAQEAATRGLETLRGLVTADNYKAMGFDSADEVKSAALADPLPVYHIPLDRLREYKAGTDPNSLLNDVGQMMYPVVANAQTRSSIVVARQGDGWKEARFGGPSLIKALSQARERDNATSGAGSYIVVQVPGLSQYYLGRRVENRLVLIPVMDMPESKFKAGVAVPAEELLQSLVVLAQRYNGLPD